MARPRKKSEGNGERVVLTPEAPAERVEAGIVEEGYEPEVQDEAVAEGDFYDQEAHDDATAAQAAAGNSQAGALIQESPPSTQMNPYVSQEEQGMEMRPAIVGPPGYGSPDSATSVGKLAPLHQHAFQSMEGTEAEISEDYGAGYDGTLKGAATVTSAPTASQTTTETEEGEEVDATDGARELADAEGVDLSQVEGTGTDGRVTKGDVETYLSAQETG